jgi:hypothetical protein
MGLGVSFRRWLCGECLGSPFGSPKQHGFSRVTAWIDNYCREHPIDNIAGAAKAFVEMHPR